MLQKHGSKKSPKILPSFEDNTSNFHKQFQEKKHSEKVFLFHIYVNKKVAQYNSLQMYHFSAEMKSDF
jgi:hypothetical protein